MNQKGFTMIELVVVIVILGILAAVAVPKFVDLSEEAADAAVKGVAGSLSSASAVNYAAFKANNAAAVTLGKTTASVDADDCDAAAAALLQGGIPDGYTLSTSTFTQDADEVETCTVTHTGSSKTAPAQVILTSN